MKTHLITSDIPIAGGNDQKALCGQLVSKAAFVFCFDTSNKGFESQPRSSLMFCTKCFHSDTRGRYLYGIIDGQRSLRGSDEAA